MISKVGPKDLDVKIKFGGGLHTRASADEIDPREAADGQNFLLDLDNRELRNRPAFDLVGTLPNSGSVLGGGSLLKADGSVSCLFQGAGNVYSWDGTNFASVGTCDPGSKLRGHWRTNNWVLADKLLLSDLSLLTPIKEWDGSTFATSSFTNETGAAFGVSFYSKYISINNERAVFANVRSTTTTPHLIVGSARGNYQQITVTDRPSSSLSNEDPYFITSLDLKPINGIVEAFGTTVFSTEKGRMFNLSGSSAKDFALEEFFAGSSASGYESLAYIGTDIIYGRQGRIESVRDTANFGNSEADDLTLEVADRISDFTGWTTVYNGRANRVYLFPTGESEVWVFNPAIRTSRLLTAGPTNQFLEQSQIQQAIGKLSPWMKWTTTHSLAFQPTFVDSMLDPSDGLEYVFMGDSSGNIYRMEGSGTSGDGGSSNIDTSWTSKIFSAPLDAELWGVEGYIKYRKNTAFTVTLTFLASGVAAFDQSITISVPAADTANYWGGLIYWGGSIYWGVANFNRLIRQKFQVPGQMSDLQVRVEVDGTSNFNINEIGLRFTAASQ